MEFLEKLFFLELVDYEDELEEVCELEIGKDKESSEANGLEENDNDKKGAQIEEEEENRSRSISVGKLKVGTLYQVSYFFVILAWS